MFKIETHAHTSGVSMCSTIDPEYMVELYQNAGYDGLVLTNHICPEFLDMLGNIPWREKVDKFMSDFIIAKEFAQNSDFVVMLGMEIRLRSLWVDFLIYGIDRDFLLGFPDICDTDVKTLKDYIDQKNALFLEAHPFRGNCKPIDPSLLHGIEVYNAHPRQPNNNDKSIEFANEHKEFILTAGSDTHLASEAALSGIKTLTLPKDSHEFAQLLRERNYTFI